MIYVITKLLVQTYQIHNLFPEATSHIVKHVALLSKLYVGSVLRTQPTHTSDFLLTFILLHMINHLMGGSVNHNLKV